ncbi:MAG TPA: M20/M25/M40 family metallo-hydrolase [Terriglobales bacterium]|nr:M20/M25/M40 family metallo-hydrolase [Terriglobales bacterium]
MRVQTLSGFLLGAGMLTAGLGAQAPTAANKPQAAIPQAAVFHLTTLPARPRPHDARAAQIIAAISPARIKKEDDALVAFGTRVSTSDYHPGGPDQAGSTTESTDTRGVVPARKWIYEQYQEIAKASGGRLQVSIDDFPVAKQRRIPEDQTMANVVATLPGTDPSDRRIFVVSGHYDSIPADFKLDAPGANDDASGTLIAMESARALSRFQFPATIEFLAVEGEEQGLIGSKHAADEAKAQGQNVAGMFDDDKTGGDQTPGYENTNTMRAFSIGVDPKATPEELRYITSNAFENDSPARELARYSAEVAQMYLPNFKVLVEFRYDRFQRGGDHESFQNDGFPAVRFSEFRENANHEHVPVSVTPAGIEMGDRGKWISTSYIANEARVNALTLAELASSPMPPAHVYFRGGQAIGTPVQWSPVEGAASYRVLLRPTFAPNWTIRIVAPPVPAPPPPTRAGAPPPDPNAPPSEKLYQITVPQSPDNYLFAVVAVDKDGHESLPTLAVARTFGRGGRGRGAAPAGRGGAGGGGS